MDINDKYRALVDMLRGYGKCVVCFSGGADSFLLLHAAIEALGVKNVTAFTLDTEFYPQEDIEFTRKTVKQLGVRHIIVEQMLLADPAICANDEHRCYYCKRSMLMRAKYESDEMDLGVVVEGSNASDVYDHQPSIRACDEQGVQSPLMACGLTKPEIWEILSKEGFFEVVRPPDSCLASRIRCDEEITPEKLRMTDLAEDYVKIFGYTVVRVRNVGGAASIELAKSDIGKFNARHFAQVKRKLLELGYTDVTVAPDGYVHGSMNKPGMSAGNSSDYNCEFTRVDEDIYS